MSRKTTSGCRLWAACRASRPLEASPTTFRSAKAASSRESRVLAGASSSTIIALIIVPPSNRNGGPYRSARLLFQSRHGKDYPGSPAFAGEYFQLSLFSESQFQALAAIVQGRP